MPASNNKPPYAANLSPEETQTLLEAEAAAWRAQSTHHSLAQMAMAKDSTTSESLKPVYINGLLDSMQKHKQTISKLIDSFPDRPITEPKGT